MYPLKKILVASLIVSMAILILGSQPLWAAPQYTVTDIGTLEGTSGTSEATGINDLGQVVGSVYRREIGDNHAMLYRNGVMTDLGTLGGITSRASSINNQGQITGVSATSTSGRDEGHAFLYSNGLLTDLLPDAQSNFGSQINNQGQVLVGFNLGGALLYDTDTATFDVLSGFSGRAMAINDSGQVAGEESTNHHLVRYEGGVLTDLGVPNATFTQVHDLNSAGQIVGGYSLADGSETPFLYSNGTLTLLGTLGDNHARAFSINASGQIVGAAGAVDSHNIFQGYHSFLYDNGVMTDLNTLVDPSTGWTLIDADAINASGLIAGTGIHYGEYHAYLLTPNVVISGIPGVPQHAGAFAISGSQIDLKWDPVAGATRYTIARSLTRGGPYTSLGNVNFSTNFRDTVPSPLTHYYYVVTAQNSFGTGLPSSECLAVTRTAAPDEAPFIHVIDSSQPDIDWTNSMVPGATNYRVYRSETSGGTRTYVGSTAGKFFGDPSPLQPRKTYYYTVTAENSYGQGPQSNEGSGTVLAVPTAVTDLSANANTPGEIFLYWTAATDAIYYQIYRSTTPTGEPQYVGATTYGTFYNDTGLMPATRYYYTVLGWNNIGLGPVSNVATAITRGIPQAPSVTATALNRSQIKLTWNESGGATNYTIYRSTVSGTGRVYIGNTSGTSFTDTHLQPATKYYYVVQASNRDGSAYSTEVSAVTSALPDAPNDVHVVYTSPTHITLNWTPTAGATSYQVYRGSVQGQLHSVIGTTPYANYGDTQLTPGTTYYYIVIAINSSGQSPKSAEVSATTQSLPNAPGNLTAIPASKSQIYLTWTAADGAATYTIYRSTTSGGPERVIVGQTTNATTFNDANLQTATRYYYVVVAGNHYGYTKSPEVSAVTNGLPGVPNLTATTVSKTQINLTWTATSDAASYTIYRSTTPGGPGRVIIGQTSGLNFSSMNLQPSTKYYYVVVAGNSYGYTKSNEVSARTDGVPETPMILYVAAINSTNIDLYWTATAGATSYTIYRSTASGTGRVIIGQTTGLSFNDSHAQPGTRYYYVVVAGNQYGFTKSPEVSGVTPAQ